MAYNVEKFRDFYRQSVVPHYYSGILHLGFSLIFLLSTMVFLASRVSTPGLGDFALIPATFILGSLVVFLLHKYPLHRPIPGMTFAYKIHTLYHHKFFTHEHITWKTPRDFHIVFFPPFAVLGFCFLVAPLLYLGVSFLFGDNAGLLCAMTGAGYFLLYEVFHFCSHLEEDHWVLKLGVLRYMRHHHIIHHDPEKMHTTNFNVVIPIWDHIFGAFERRTEGQ